MCGFIGRGLRLKAPGLPLQNSRVLFLSCRAGAMQERCPSTEKAWGGPASESAPTDLGAQTELQLPLYSADARRRAGGAWGLRPSATLSLVRELYSRVINPASCQRTNHFSKKEDSGFQCLMTYYEVQPRGKIVLKILKGTSPGLPPLVEISIQDLFEAPGPVASSRDRDNTVCISELTATACFSCGSLQELCMSRWLSGGTDRGDTIVTIVQPPAPQFQGWG